MGDIESILAELQAARERLEQALLVLEKEPDDREGPEESTPDSEGRTSF